MKREHSGAHSANSFRNVLLIFFLVLLLVLPFFLNPYLLHIMIMTFLFAYLSRNWDLIGGFAGQFFLGPVVMFGIGGYTSTLLNVHLNLSPWIGMVPGGILAAVNPAPEQRQVRQVNPSQGISRPADNKHLVPDQV